MNELALPQANVASNRSASSIQALAYTLTDIWEMALKVADSHLFAGIDTPDKAFTLMLLCQSEGIHPMQAVRRFDIIEGKPAMKAPAIQAEFQARGGKIKIVRSDAEEARAVFSHPVHQPDGFEMAVTYAEFEKSGLVKGKDGIKKNWRMSPADMLWWRLMSKGIKKIDPGIVVGIGSAEEMMDAIESSASLSPVARLDPPPGQGFSPQLSYADPAVIGFAESGFDERPYHRVVTDAVKATGELLVGMAKSAGVDWADVGLEIDPHDVHRHILHAAINLGYAEGPAPTKLKGAIEALTKVYKAERQWVRRELMSRLESLQETFQEAIREKLDAESPDDAPTTGPDGEVYEPGVNC